FYGAADFTEVLAEGVTRIDRPLLQIPRDIQLFTQRAPTSDRLRLAPFSFPDFLCDGQQVIGVFCRKEQATIVIRKSHITTFDDKGPEARRVQRRGIASIETLGTRWARPVAENWQTNLSQLRCVPVRAPHNDSSETTI